MKFNVLVRPDAEDLHVSKRERGLRFTRDLEPDDLSPLQCETCSRTGCGDIAGPFCE